MARDFEDLHDLDDLDDRELRDLVRERLDDTSAIDAENITVRVQDGTVHLLGRVGTESELRIAERVLTDVLGVRDYESELVVDPLRRSEESEDAEEASERNGTGDYLGDRPALQDDGSSGSGSGDDDLESRLYGTTDVQSAIGEGETYIPPLEPTPEGMAGGDEGPRVYPEDH